MKDTIRTLTEAFGPTGYETGIQKIIRDMVLPLADQVSTDTLGNLIAVKKGSGGGRRIMIAAHMDEIGIMVTHIDDKGFIRFAPLGGLPAHIAIGQRVVFSNGTIGVVGSERLDSAKDLKPEKMFVDIGARSRDQCAGRVKLGDVASYHQEFVDLGERMVAKAMDDRVGCAILVETLRQAADSPHDLYFVFTVQEEVGLRGARTAAYSIEPDLGLAVDVTGVGDTPKPRRMDVSLGGGAAVKIKDGSILCHPSVVRLLMETAERNSIPVQPEVLELGGTDAGAIHLSRGGVPGGGISIPCRYIHTPGEMVDRGDVKACIDLLTAVLLGDLNL